MIVLLLIALTAIWLVALYGTYEESKREKYDVEIHPGAVTYGTHSTSLEPEAKATVAHELIGAPAMLTGTAIRSMAHHGHAKMPSMSTAKVVRTASSVTAKHYGSGGGGEATIMTTTGRSSSQRGIIYTETSVAIPVLAMNTPSSASLASSRSAIGPRRMPGYDGDEEGDEVTDGEGTWIWDGEGWVLAEGSEKIEGGKLYRYIGGVWVLIGDQSEPGDLPVGATPWLVMTLLAAAYAGRKSVRKQNNA